MRGETHVQRGTERRYYRCPTLGCRARRCPADLVEEIVLASIAEAVLPASVIDTARAELRRRLETPEIAVAGRQRARLQTRLEQLRKQHAWGDLSDADYQQMRDATRATLASSRTETGSPRSTPTGCRSLHCPTRSQRRPRHAARSSVGSSSSGS